MKIHKGIGKNKDTIILTLLILLCIFHIVNNIIILNLDNLPFCCDDRVYYNSSRNLYAAIKEGDVAHIINSLSGQALFKPLFFQFTTTIFFFIFGISEDVAVLTNSLYFIILIFSSYHIGKNLKNKRFGLLSSFIISFLPGIFAFSRVYYLDFALASLVGLNFLYLIKTDYFTKTNSSIILAVILAIGSLIKWTFPLYFIGPIILYFIKSYKKNQKNKISKFYPNVLLSFLTFTIIIFPWYYYNLSTTVGSISQILFNKTLLSLTQLLSNFQMHLKNLLLGVNLNLILFAVIILYFVIKIKNRYKWLLISGNILPFLVSIITHTRNLRFNVPLLPYIGVIIAFVIYDLSSYLKKPFIKVILVSFIIITILSSFFFISYNFAPCSMMDCNQRIHFGLRQIDTKDWGINRIYELSQYNNKRFIVLSPTTIASTIGLELQYLNSTVYMPIGTLLGDYGPLNYTYYHDILVNSDFIIKDSSINAINNYKHNKEAFSFYKYLYSVFENNSNNFILTQTYDFPYNNTLLIYKKKTVNDQSKN